ncbi:MAG: hypothetical protein Q7T74_06145, partial [Candidatus Saccharibacteria bacterium]|nr:hypothetical protein [Candidatus Saccharibacteria bacterium]
MEIGTVNTDDAIAAKFTISADTDGDDVYGIYNTVNTGTGTPSTTRNAYAMYNALTNSADGGGAPIVYGIYNSMDVTANPNASYKDIYGIANTSLDYSAKYTEQFGLNNILKIGGEGSTGFGSTSEM